MLLKLMNSLNYVRCKIDLSQILQNPALLFTHLHSSGLETITVASLFRKKICNCLRTKLFPVLSAENLYVPQVRISEPHVSISSF